MSPDDAQVLLGMLCAGLGVVLFGLGRIICAERERRDR